MGEQRTTPEQLAEGRRLLAAASDGPWHARQYRDGEWTLRERGEDGRGFHIAGFALNQEDAEVCAWLRNAAEALFADAEALAGARDEVGRLRLRIKDALVTSWEERSAGDALDDVRAVLEDALAPEKEGVSE